MTIAVKKQIFCFEVHVRGEARKYHIRIGTDKCSADGEINWMHVREVAYKMLLRCTGIRHDQSVIEICQVDDRSPQKRQERGSWQDRYG